MNVYLQIKSNRICLRGRGDGDVEKGDVELERGLYGADFEFQEYGDGENVGLKTQLLNG